MLKKVILFWCMVLLLTGAAAAQVKKGQTVYISARSVPLKLGTEFFARTTGTLDYGDQVTVLQLNGTWVELRSDRANISGWTAQTNVTAKRIVATGGSGSASSQDEAAAGKGINEEVETIYRETKGVDFSGVDAVEAIRVSNEDLLRFITEGRLSMGDD
jgi:hypothetical protein